MSLSDYGLSMTSGKRELITNYIYFYHLDKFVILPTYPESVTDSFESTWTPSHALGRTSAPQAYGYSQNSAMSFALSLHRDLMDDINTGVSNLKSNVVSITQDDYIDILIKELLAMALPSYEEYTYNNRSLKPPIAAVRFGNQVFIKGVVKNVKVTYKGPVLSDNKYAQVDINFTMQETDPYDAESIEQAGSFRGFMSTLDIFDNGEDNSSNMPESTYDLVDNSKYKSASTEVVDNKDTGNTGNVEKEVSTVALKIKSKIGVGVEEDGVKKITNKTSGRMGLNTAGAGVSSGGKASMFINKRTFMEGLSY